MPKFKYKAKRNSTQYENGILEAGSSREAIEELVRQGLTPISIEESNGGIELAIFKNWHEFFEKKVGLTELIVFCRQMYSLTKAGVPLIKAIAGLAESAEHKGLKKSLVKMNRDLSGGKSLTMSLQEQNKIFSNLFVSMVNVGENTGRLEDVFRQLAEYYSLEYETRKRIVSAMRYPILVLLFIVAAIVILNIFVIPVFSSMFAKFGVDLPITTRILIGSSNFFLKYWPALAVVAVVTPILIKWALTKKKFRLIWDRYKLKIPVLGSILNRSLLSRFCRSFSLMLQAGVPLNVSLTLVADAIDNMYLKEKVLAMRKSIEQGNALSICATQSNMFTPLVLQMFAVGDETGRVDELLIEAADYYEREVDYDLKSLTSKIEPLLLVVVALMVGLLALGIFTPMWDMYGAMQGK